MKTIKTPYLAVNFSIYFVCYVHVCLHFVVSLKVRKVCLSQTLKISLNKTFQSLNLIAGARKLDHVAKYRVIKVFILGISAT